MAFLGLISGTIPRQEKIFKNLKEKIVQNEFGITSVLISDDFVYIPRHGKDPKKHTLPHVINHQANIKALKDMGVSEIIGINSTGSLKRGLAPGSIVVPDDFISISVTPTIFSDRASHVVPSLSDKVREGLIAAASDCNIYVVGKGTYWQTTGPRLETKAEIRFMSKFADIVGMTMASEAILANEFGLPYASLCSVDNYGNGLTKVPLSEHDIKEGNRTNVRTAVKIITRYIERGHTYEVFKKRR